MRRRWIGSACAFLVGAIGCSSGASDGPATITSEPFALVEIFTSEGCDACPVADDYVNALVAKERLSGRRVFAIAWHVDYWDDLGWKDPYSAPWATERQQPYEDLNKTTIGTPEMFVNGASRTYETAPVQRAVESALLVPANTSIALSLPPSEKFTLRVGYRVQGAPAGSLLWIVLVERGLSGMPTAGELAGRTLKHDNVARARVIVPAGEGTATLHPPDELRRENASLIAFVQLAETLRIVGATQIDLR